MTTLYLSRMSVKAERVNKTIITQLRHYIAEHERDWDICVQPLTYDYISEVHRATSLPLFSLALPRQPPGPTAFCLSDGVADGSYRKYISTCLRDQLLQRLSSMRQGTDRRIKTPSAVIKTVKLKNHATRQR